jgi:hypothetical protein
MLKERKKNDSIEKSGKINQGKKKKREGKIFKISG